jgi:hypothetical protein
MKSYEINKFALENFADYLIRLGAMHEPIDMEIELSGFLRNKQEIEIIYNGTPEKEDKEMLTDHINKMCKTSKWVRIYAGKVKEFNND